ncbi:MAG: hypothetical protein Q4G26_15075 [Paracoccus sp. (in: a-proteobacteria)]|nr:hypothetical protein [Paracoccus sp. (in: a-proteobacteria)]
MPKTAATRYRVVKDFDFCPRANVVMAFRADESGYLWALIGLGHVMLGAMLQGLLGAAGAAARLGLAIGYWLIKERADLRRGGSLRDGLIDAGFVGVGAFYTGERWWPVAVMASVALGAWLKERRR